ncbi:MAG TPA: hypothetical protein V6C89_12100 [Drouetiella sp.]|jgi:hypothetical protein
MNVKRTAATLIIRVIALLMVAYAVPSSGALAAPAAAGNTTGALDVNPGYAAYQREMYFQRFPAAREGGPTEMGGHDQVKDKKSMGPGNVIHSKSGPVFMWPVSIPTATSPVPTKRDEMVNDDMFKTFGYPVSDTQLQVIQRYNQNRMLEQAFDPEKIMWASSATAGMQATSAANSAASASVNQAQSAIDFTKKYLTNFTSEAGNRWQKIRDQLFIPMAILLLLPGAVLAQVKAIVSQGSPVLGDTNPFEGILRSIIAIFLIPATFLVINYGIDVSNSITFTIADEYKRIFGTDMYEDAQCAQKRAFPVNPSDRNDNAVIAGENPPTGQGTTAWDPYEALTLNLRQYDPCAKIDKTRTPDERVRDAKKITRLMMNGANAGLTGTWNVMCAFQMAFLYYLWCMGPIAAALWVWPMQRLRTALPSWIEGVVTLCFWSLFWNTTVLLMACFRGVGDSGTVIMSALNFLANMCVKYAFDFSGLVSQGASSGVSNAVQQAMQGGGAAAGGAGGRGAAAGAPGAHGGAAAGGAHPGGTTAGAHPTGAAGLNSALRTASAQNAHSGVMGNASGIPGLTGDHGGMPMSNSLTAGNPALTANHGAMPGSASTVGVGRDAGLPPGATAGHMNTFAGGPGADGSVIPASFSSGGNSPFTFASTGGNPAALAGHPGGDFSASALSQGGNSLGLHMNNGQLQVNPQALHNLQNAMNDPNSAAHRELAGAMNALQHGDPRALAQLAQQGAQGINGLDPQTSRALGALAMDAQQMYAQGSTGLSPADMSAVQQFASGQLGPNGMPAIGFDANGTLTNNLTGSPIDFSNTNLTNLNSMALNGLPSSDPALNPGITYDPRTGQPTNETFAQMMANGSMQSLPTNGFDGLANSNGTNLSNMSLVDSSGNPIGAGMVNAQGGFTGGYSPAGDVYALNSNTGTPMARYDAETHQWQATNAQGVPNGIVMGSNGDWVAPAPGGVAGSGGGAGAVPVTYDNGTQQWYTSNSGGNVVYDQTANGGAGGFTTPQGVALNYDGNTYTAQNDSSIRYNQDQNSFVSTTTGAPLQSGSDGQWYASGSNGSVVLNPADNNLYMAGSNYGSGAQVSYSSTSDYGGGGTYTAAGGQVYYDNAKNSFEVAGSGPSGGAAVSYSNGTWYANDTNNQIAYNTSSHQLEASGSSAALQYNAQTGTYSSYDNQVQYNSATQSFQAGGQSVTATGDQWYASNSNYTVAYDQQNHRFEASGTTQPLVYGDTAGGGQGWSAAGTNGSIVYDTSTGTYASAGGQAPVYYSRGTSSDGSGGTYFASGTNGSVYYDTSAQTWAGAGAGGQPVAYSYDSSSQTWAPAQGGGVVGGNEYRVDYSSAQQQAQQQQQYDQRQFADQSQYAQQTQVQQQYAQYAAQQLEQQYAAQQLQQQNSYQTQQQQDAQNYVRQQDAQNYANQPQQIAYQQPQQPDSQYYTQQGGGYPQAAYQPDVQVNQPSQYQNVSFDQTSGGGVGGGGGGGGSATFETRSESPTSYGQSYGSVGNVENQYLASAASASDAVFHQETPYHHHEAHHDAHNEPAPVEHERAQPQDWGYQGHADAGNHPTSSADYYSRPVQPQGGQTARPAGGLNAFVPVPAMRPRQQQPQAGQGNKPHPGQTNKPPQQPHQEQPPEGPIIRKGALDINAKQGGYVTDDEKRRRQQELLKESWAEYQEGQNPEEEA